MLRRQTQELPCGHDPFSITYKSCATIPVAVANARIRVPLGGGVHTSCATRSSALSGSLRLPPVSRTEHHVSHFPLTNTSSPPQSQTPRQSTPCGQHEYLRETRRQMSSRSRAAVCPHGLTCPQGQSYPRHLLTGPAQSPRLAPPIVSTCRSRYTAGAWQSAPYHPRSTAAEESTPAQAPEDAWLPRDPPRTRPSPFRSGALRRCRQTCSD